MSFRRGQQVVCILPSEYRWGPTLPSHYVVPQKGGVYTIREIVPMGPRTGLRFEEIVNPPYQFGDGFAEGSFNSEWFRPIVKTNISALERIARDVTEGKPVKITEPA